MTIEQLDTVMSIAQANTTNGTQPRIFPYNDLTNADWFTTLYGSEMHYVEDWHTWLIWNGKQWKKDKTSQIDRLAHKATRHMLSAAAKIDDDDKRKVAIKWVASTQNRQRLSAMIALAATIEGIKLEHSEFDCNHWLLNVANGTLNLETGKLQQHSSADLITRLIDVHYDVSATCPTWLAFLDRIFQSSTELIRYVQKAVGYSLTGDVSEQCLHFCYGEGKNGKSTFFEVLMTLLNTSEYAQKAPSTMLMTQKFEGIPVDVARLQGTRFVIASEIEKGMRLNEAKVKDLTGGDTLTARYMRENPFSFTPTHKLWIYGNHKPTVRGIDEGIWRRLRLIPFTVTIPESERDPHLKEKLLAELSGILAWAVAGCALWRCEGLANIPQIVSAATQEYRDASDTIKQFICDECEQARGYKTLFATVYNQYANWAKDGHEFVMSKREFSERLGKAGFAVVSGNGNRKYCKGLALSDAVSRALTSEKDQ